MPFAFEDFGRDVVRSAADGLLLLALILKLGGQPEVSKLDLHVLVEEEIAELEVAVDDLVLVQVLERVDDLGEVALHLDLGEPLAALDELVEGLQLLPAVLGSSIAPGGCRRSRGLRRRARTGRCSGGAATCGS